MDTWTIRIKGDIDIVVPADLNCLTTYVLLEQEDWFEDEMELVRRYVKPGMNCIDVGACFGVYALTMAKLTGGKGVVVAYEPVEEANGYLLKSIAENKFEEIVKPCNQAIAEATRKGKIYTKNGLEYAATDSPIWGRMGNETTFIDLDNSLSEFAVNSVDLLKIDAASDTPLVLKGASSILANNNPLVIFDRTSCIDLNEAVAHQFSKLGYKIYAYDRCLNVLEEVGYENWQLLSCLNLIAFKDCLIDTVKSFGLRICLKGCSETKVNGAVVFDFSLASLVGLIEKVESDVEYLPIARKLLAAANDNVADFVEDVEANVDILLALVRLFLITGLKTDALKLLAGVIPILFRHRNSDAFLLKISPHPFAEREDLLPARKVLADCLTLLVVHQRVSSFFISDWKTVGMALKENPKSLRILKTYALMLIRHGKPLKIEASSLLLSGDRTHNLSIWADIAGRANSKTLATLMSNRLEGYQEDLYYPHPGDWNERIRLTTLSTDSDVLPRHPDAGELVYEGSVLAQVMHNGLRVVKDGYYASEVTRNIAVLRGIHEPQEELVFHKVLDYIKAGSVMLELGAYWAFYSLWFASRVGDSKNYMVEPFSSNLQVGIANFSLNNLSGFFHQAFVGEEEGLHLENSGINKILHPKISVDQFCHKVGIQHLHVLHSDIQGFELQMLRGAQQMMADGRIDYIFISTHSDDSLHFQCIRRLRYFGYSIIAEHSMAESYSYDGLIVAKRNGAEGPSHIAISKRIGKDK